MPAVVLNTTCNIIFAISSIYSVAPEIVPAVLEHYWQMLWIGKYNYFGEQKNQKQYDIPFSNELHWNEFQAVNAIVKHH